MSWPGRPRQIHAFCRSRSPEARSAYCATPAYGGTSASVHRTGPFRCERRPVSRGSSYLGSVTSEGDPWADREGPYSLPRYVTEPPAKEFFIPYVNGPAEAEDLWSRFAARHPTSRRVYSLTYTHDNQKIEVQVGQERKVYSRRGGRDGYAASADFDRRGKREGSTVLAIVDAGAVIEIWTVLLSGRWANPSIVDPWALESIQYFKPPAP